MNSAARPTVTIRPVAPGDRDAWARLFVDYGTFYETDFSADVIAGVWAWLMDDAHSTNALVAVSSSDAVVGFAIYRPVADTFTAANGWFLDDLYVDPAARRVGAASALIAEITAIAKAAGGGTLRWITADDNLRAQRIYDKVATRAAWITYEVTT